MAIDVTEQHTTGFIASFSDIHIVDYSLRGMDFYSENRVEYDMRDRNEEAMSNLEIGDEVIIKMGKPNGYIISVSEKYKLCNGKRGVIIGLPAKSTPAFYSIGDIKYKYVVKLYYKPEQKYSGFVFNDDGSISFRFSRGELSLLRKTGNGR